MNKLITMHIIALSIVAATAVFTTVNANSLDFVIVSEYYIKL